MDKSRYGIDPEPNFAQQVVELRKVVNFRTLDDLERMMNASRGAGTTTMLIKGALENRAVLVTHTQQWADQLIEKHPKLRAVNFSSKIGGEKVLIDNGVNWLLLKEAQKLRKMIETLLNYIEVKHIKE